MVKFVVFTSHYAKVRESAPSRGIQVVIKVVDRKLEEEKKQATLEILQGLRNFAGLRIFTAYEFGCSCG